MDPTSRPLAASDRLRILVEELLGCRDVTTTMIYTHVLNRGGLGVKSPADLLGDSGTGLPD